MSLQKLHKNNVFNLSKAQQYLKTNIWTIKVSCVGGAYLEEVAHKKCEINSKTTLTELCDIILGMFDFDNDHLHRFFISRSGYTGEEIGNEELTLEDIFPLDKGHGLFMNFDFGDAWLFRVIKMAKKTTFSPDIQYPVVVQEIGENPEQYPMYEDEEWE